MLQVQAVSLLGPWGQDGRQMGPGEVGIRHSCQAGLAFNKYSFCTLDLFGQEKYSRTWGEELLL